MLGQGNGEVGRDDTFLNRLFFSLTPISTSPLKVYQYTVTELLINCIY